MRECELLCIMKEMADAYGRGLSVEDVEPRVNRKLSRTNRMWGYRVGIISNEKCMLWRKFDYWSSVMPTNCCYVSSSWQVLVNIAKAPHYGTGCLQITGHILSNSPLWFSRPRCRKLCVIGSRWHALCHVLCINWGLVGRQWRLYFRVWRRVVWRSIETCCFLL